MAFKNPKELSDNYLHLGRGHTPSQEELDNEVRNMFRNREEGLKYIYGSFNEGQDRNNALERLNKVYPENRTLRDRWNNYLDNGFLGDNVDYWNNEAVEIEKQLPFKDQPEHDKWLNMGATWMGEPEWLNMTDELLKRYEGGK